MVDHARLLIALRRISSVLLLGIAPVLVNVFVLAASYKHNFLFDFHGDLYNAGKAIIHGRDPYRAAYLDHLAAVARAGGHPSTKFAVPVYPAPGLIAAAPFALLPYKIAGIVYTLLSAAALGGGLWLLGVRDWRCYGAAFLSWPALHSLRLGQVNGFLVLGVALAWHFRARLIAPAAAIAGVVVGKVLLWPLAFWLLITRRWRTAVSAVAIAAILTASSWAIIGFDGFSAYPRLLRDLSAVEGNAGISFVSVAGAAGIARIVGDLLALATGAALLITALYRTRADGDPDDGDRRALGLTVMAGLVLSPLVWPHYLTLTLIPIALIAPRFSPLWLAPLLSYLAPTELTHGDLWRMLPYLAIEALVIASLCLQGARGATGRLRLGLRSTVRSHIAALRPTTGP